MSKPVMQRRNRKSLRAESLETRLLLAADTMNSWQNPVDCNDTNGDGFVTPLDGMIVINNINRYGARQLGEAPSGEPGSTLQTMMVDANGDGFASVLDVIQVIDALNPAGEGESVGVRLETTDLEGNVITTANVGDQFQLRAYVSDMRGEEVGGVFAAYLDVTYDSSLASATSDSIEYGDNYVNGQVGDTTTPGLIDEAGAFSGSLSPLGDGEFLLFTVTMNADAPGEVSFVSDPADTKPANEVLLFDVDSAIDDGDISFGAVSLTIEGETNMTADPAIATNLDGDTVELEIESPLNLPINGIDELGEGLTYTVSVDDPALVDAQFTSGNRSWSVEVADHGTMVFEFFEDKAPRVTERFITLTESDFFNGITFHRVIDGFVIQGGDPLGTGTGGSDLGAFDDQFHVDLQHNQAGVLSMAKSSDDTNNSQFFVTDAETPWLDFNHSIFGQLVEGYDVLDSISSVPVSALRNQPLDNVVISNATVFEDNENAVLTLRALASSGTAEVTVTATDADNRSVSETFTINLAESSQNTSPFLADIPKDFSAIAGSTFEFQLNATDIEGDELIYEVDVVSPSSASASVDATGLVQVAVPSSSSADEVLLDVSVRQSGSATDEQRVAIAIEQTLAGQATDDEFDVNEDVTENFLDVLANDDFEETATIISITPGDDLNGMANIDSDGQTIVYAPAPDFFGTATFTYLAQTSEGLFEGSVTVNVANVLDGPNAVDDFFPQDLDEADPLRGLFVEDSDGDIPLTSLFLNDLNQDGAEQEIMTITNVTDPQFGTVTWNAFQIRYTPSPDFFGTDTFTYTTTGNDTELTSTGNVTIEIAEENDAPVVEGETRDATSGQTTIFSADELLSNDSPGPENESDQTLRILELNYSGTGTAILNDDGNIEYTPADGFTGMETISYVVEDNGTTQGAAEPLSTTADLVVNVMADPDAIPNEPPIANDDAFDVVADRPNQLINVLANDTTEPDETLSLTAIINEPQNGTVTISFDTLILIYTPDSGFTGTDSFTYEVSDGNGGVATADVVLTVASEDPVDPDPVDPDPVDPDPVDPDPVDPDPVDPDPVDPDPVDPDPVDPDPVDPDPVDPDPVDPDPVDPDPVDPDPVDPDPVDPDPVDPDPVDPDPVDPDPVDPDPVDPDPVDPDPYANSVYSGQIFNDLDNDGIRDFNENGIGGVTVVLTGVDADGNDVRRETTTSITGLFTFSSVAPGNYVVSQVQPPFIQDGVNIYELQVSSPEDDRLQLSESDNRNLFVTEQLIQSQGNLYRERGMFNRFALIDALSSQRAPGLLVVMDGDELSWVEDRGGWSEMGSIGITRSGDSLILSSSVLGTTELSMSDASRVQLIGGMGQYTLIRITGVTSEVMSAAAVDEAFAT